MLPVNSAMSKTPGDYDLIISAVSSISLDVESSIQQWASFTTLLIQYFAFRLTIILPNFNEAQT